MHSTNVNNYPRNQMTKHTEAMKLALEAYMAAGFGNSTDFALQRKAYDLALQALAEQPAPVQQEPLDDHAEKEDVESLKRQLSLQTSMCIAYKKENEQLLAANKDCINHFDALKADYDALRAQQEPVAWALYQRNRLLSFWMDKGDAYDFEFTSEHRWEPLYTSPPAQRKPLHIGEETAAFKAWFDAWWIGDGEQGETIPTQSDKHFLTYLDQYTLGFGAWMAAKHAAHGIKENK